MRRYIGGGAVAILALGLYAWIALAGRTTIPVRLWPSAATADLPSGIIVLVGVVIGVCAAVASAMLLPRQSSTASQPTIAETARANLVLVTSVGIAVGAGILLVAAVHGGTLGAADAALTYLLGGLAVLATTQALRSLAGGDGVSFDSYWGGLGGSQGGWRVSATTTVLVLALLLIAGTVAVATGHGPRISDAGSGKGSSAGGASNGGNTLEPGAGSNQGAVGNAAAGAPTGNHS